MFLIRILIIISIFFSFSFSKGEVSRIFAHKESANNTTYSVNGTKYKWGRGDNLVIDGFEYAGHRYNYVSNSSIIKIRRVDNSYATGEPCGLFAERKGNKGNYTLETDYPQTNGSCDMAKVMGGRVINIGALDLFKNVSNNWDTAKNIERVDFISPNGIIAPAKSSDLTKAGHIVTEKSGNNELRIAPILSIDANNNPTSYGNLVRVMPHSSSSSYIRYKNCNIELPDGNSTYRRALGFYRDNKKSTEGQQGKVWHLGNSNEPMGMAFVSLNELGVNAGQKYYGFSYFGRDVTSSMDLTDINTFPHDTSGDTADPYGGVASYFVDAELGYGICYGMIDDGRSIYEMDLSSSSIFKEIKIDAKFLGEGTAYRATNHKLYAFQTYTNSGSTTEHGDYSTLYSIDFNSKNSPINVYKEKEHILDYEVEGAEFYYDPNIKKEILYIIASNNQKKNRYYLHAFYADNWNNELEGYPKTIAKYKLDSLAIDPNTGEAYGIDDAGKHTAPKVYKLNLKTGVATFIFKARDNFDAEGLAFAIDGKLYTEDDGGYSKLPRKIYRVDLKQKRFIETRNLSGTRDIEGLSCNGVRSAPKFTISGYIFDDNNSNGIKDGVESGLNKDSFIKICSSNNKFLKSVKADNNTGKYILNNIILGEYKLIEDASNTHDCNTSKDIDGYISTSQNIIDISVNTNINKNFANSKDSISIPFTCSNNAYIFSSKAFNAKTDVNSFDLSTGEKLSSKYNINRYNINAIGYNVIDNYLWGFDRGRYKVVRIDSNYTKRFYNIDKLPTFEPADDTSPTYHAGDVSLDGILYLFTISKKDTLYLVDVNHLSINYLKTLPSIHLDSEVDVSDFAFSPIDNMIYTVDWNENLIKIDQNSGKVTNLGHLDAIPSSGNVASIFFDKDGNLYAHHSYKADVYKIDISKVKAEYYSNIGTTLHGDGARCANAKISEIKPKISINNVTKLEGDSGFTDFNFTISLNKPAPKGGLTFDYTTKDGTAGDEDFSDNNDTNNTTVNNSDNNDDSNSSSGGSSWWDIIKDWLNGQSSHHDKKSLTSIEKHNSKKNISFQKEGDSEDNNNENSNNGGTTTNIADYKKIVGKVTINEGETNATISVKVIGDNEVEDDETFYVVLLPSEMNSFIPIGTGTIITDDENISKKLLAEYRFDECILNGTNGEVRDSSGNNFHGVAILKDKDGKLPITSSKEKIINRSAKFTMSDKSFVKISNFNDFNSSKFSVSMWVKVHENVNGWQTLLHKGASNNGTNGVFRIKYNYNYGNDKLGLYTTFSDKSSRSFYKTDIGLKDKAWHYLAVIYENREYKIYLDKQLVVSKKYNKDLISPNNELHIGGKAYVSNMYIDEVKIFDTALKSKQIKDIFNNESSGKNWDGSNRDECLCSDSMTPFVCNNTLYISNRTKMGTGSGDSGKTWLHSIDQNSTPYSFNYIGNGYSSSYNALGYNSVDNFMYALFETHLLKIDRDAKVIDLGAVEGLTTQLYAGAFDRDGNYFVSSNGGADDKIYQIDIKEKKVVKTINLKYSIKGKNEPVKFWDMTIDKSGDYFYAMLLDNSNEDINDKFVKIDKNSGVMSVINDKPKGLDSAIDTIFSDIDGDIFIMERNNGFYKIDSDTGDLYKLSTTDELSYYNDGANCAEANISEPSTISIEEKVVDFEGDSGKKIFKFNISFSKPAPENAGFWVKYSDGVNAISPLGTAFYKGEHSKDYDFNGDARFIDIPKGTTSYELNATIYGDIEIEPNEEFYIEIYNGKNLAIKNGKGIGVIVNDDNAIFNIERVGSNNIKPTNIDEQREKESLYTQISNRDFNYCIVSYDKNESNFKEYPIEDITLKIELIDNTSTTNKVMYTCYKYLDHKSSRFDITDNHDLELNATKDAIYKISYLEHNQTIVKGDFSNGKAFENNSSIRTIYSRDDFSIRPAGFKLMLWADDGTIRDHLATSNQKESYGIALASGYKYELQVKALNYKGLIDTNYKPKISYKNKESNILSPIQEVNATLLFDGNKSICNDTTDKELKYYDFIDGINSNKEFSRDNVGNFIIKVKDENWTNLDHYNGTSQLGCNINSSSNELDSSGKFGCNIDTTFSINSDDPLYNHYYDLKVYFQPYSFDVNLDVKSKTNSGHNDFLYMGDLTQSDKMAILIDGNITAKEKGGKITTNFTKDCLAHKVQLSLDYTITTDRGVFHNPNPDTVVIKTTKKTASNAEGDIVKIQKKEQLNSNIKDDESDDDDDDNEDENSLQIFETNALDNNITIKEEDFKNSKKGSVDIALLYNIKKSFNKTINPVKIDFHKAKVSSIEAGSNLADNEINDFIPTGEQILNKSKTLYYATVMPDKENYPDSFSSSISTPIGAYIYCDFNRTLCNDMVGDNGLNSFKTQNGWYTSAFHNSTIDGTVNPKQSDTLSTRNNRLESISIQPNSIPNFNQGRKGRLENLKTNYIGPVISLTTPVEVEVNLNPSPWLSYHPTPSRGGNPFYHVKFRADNNGTMSGVGQTGNIIGVKGNRKPTNKMDW